GTEVLSRGSWPPRRQVRHVPQTLPHAVFYGVTRACSRRSHAQNQAWIIEIRIASKGYIAAFINHIDIERFAHAVHTAPRDQAAGCGKATLDCIANRR